MATVITKEFRRLHREVFESFQVQIDTISKECLEATKPAIDSRNEELRAEDERHGQISREIWNRADKMLKPLRKPFEERIGAVIAERDAALNALKAEHGVD